MRTPTGVRGAQRSFGQSLELSELWRWDYFMVEGVRGVYAMKITFEVDGECDFLRFMFSEG